MECRAVGSGRAAGGQLVLDHLRREESMERRAVGGGRAADAQRHRRRLREATGTRRRAEAEAAALRARGYWSQSSGATVALTARATAAVAAGKAWTSLKPSFCFTLWFGVMRTPVESSLYVSKYWPGGSSWMPCASRKAESVLSTNGKGMPAQKGLKRPSQWFGT